MEDLRERLLTPKEVSVRLSVSERTLGNWRFEKRSLPYVKFGKFVRYREVDVNEFIERSSIVPEVIELATCYVPQ